VTEHNWDGAQSGAQRPHYDDEWKDEAARFLFHDIDPEPRVRGIMSIKRCNQWIDVETTKDEPDREIIAMLNRRKQDIREWKADHDGSPQLAATDGGEDNETDEDGTDNNDS
jgi:hypothetical protein